VARVSSIVGVAYEVTNQTLYERLTDEDVQQFAFVNGIRHAWPYIRELCQSLSLRLGVTPMLLGVVPPSVQSEVAAQDKDFVWPESARGASPSSS
jgi:hypothetical protein